MFYYLYLNVFNPDNLLRFFRVFKYITVRAGFSLFTSFLVGLVVTKWIIKYLRNKKSLDRGREDVPETHKGKVGTPTMGGLAIFISSMFSILLWNDLSNGYVLITILTLFMSFLIGFSDDYLKVFTNKGKGLKAIYKVVLLVIASLVNIFLQHQGFQMILSYLAVALFTGLTAWDVQKIKHLGRSDYPRGGLAVMGALTLYLDFINLFIHLLYILGAGRRD